MTKLVLVLVLVLVLLVLVLLVLSELPALPEPALRAGASATRPLAMGS
jgi:hypothetical protein